ncbi:hypothetical protein HK096_005342, partial [Nowakowskiella sp. JEL0078]
MKTLSAPTDTKSKNFAIKQEAVRKDIKICFGVLKAQFSILNYPICLWSKEDMGIVMRAY